ncbi:hypothetical protein STEG23_009931, partial [Scotinomys teguina]
MARGRDIERVQSGHDSEPCGERGEGKEEGREKDREQQPGEQRLPCCQPKTVAVYWPITMASVWKRLQRVGKHASKFQFVASYQELMVECTKKWQPDKLVVVWTRRSRRKSSK